MPEVTANTRRLLERIPDPKLTLKNLTHVPADMGADSEAARTCRPSSAPHTYVNFSWFLVQKTTESAPAKERPPGSPP